MDKLQEAIEYIATHVKTYGGLSIYREVMEILNPHDPKKFMECDTCRAKPGSPELCKGCLHNRKLINKLNNQ